MGKPRDAAKERLWRRVLQRHAASGLGTGGFCKREGITEHQFHWWRRTLRERDQHQARAAQRTRTARPVRARRTREAASPFLPVHLPLPIGAPIEVVHPRGHVVRIPAWFDATVLGRILATLDVPAASTEEA